MASVRVLRFCLLATAAALVGACGGTTSASDTFDTTADQTEGELTAAGMKIGRYKLSGTPTPGAYGELVLKSSHAFEAKAYGGSFWGPASEEETADIKGTFRLAGGTLTLLTRKGNEYGVYDVVQDGGKYRFSEQGTSHKFVMTYADSGTALEPDAPGKNPGTPPNVAGGTQLHCEAGLFATNFSVSRTGGWMYHFTERTPRTLEHVKLTQNPDEASGGGRLRFVGSSPNPNGRDYEVSIPDSALRAGAHGVTVDVSFGSALGGVFTAGSVVCDAVD